jgi:hypothetical protein
MIHFRNHSFAILILMGRFFSFIRRLYRAGIFELSRSLLPQRHLLARPLPSLLVAHRSRRSFPDHLRYIGQHHVHVLVKRLEIAFTCPSDPAPKGGRSRGEI